MYELRCTEETALKIKEKDDSRPAGQSTFQATLGIPIVTDENVPVGVIEMRSNGVLVKRYTI